MLLRKTTSYFQGLQEMPFIYPEIHEILKVNLVWSLKWFPNSMLVSIQIHLLPHSTSIITKHITVIHSAEIYGTGIRWQRWTMHGFPTGAKQMATPFCTSEPCLGSSHPFSQVCVSLVNSQSPAQAQLTWHLLCRAFPDPHFLSFPVRIRGFLIFIPIALDRCLCYSICHTVSGELSVFPQIENEHL